MGDTHEAVFLPVASHKLQLCYGTPLRSYIGVARVAVVDIQLYLEIYSFLHSLVSSFRDLTVDFMFIMWWILGFVHALDVHSL